MLLKQYLNDMERNEALEIFKVSQRRGMSCANIPGDTSLNARSPPLFARFSLEARGWPSRVTIFLNKYTFRNCPRIVTATRFARNFVPRPHFFLLLHRSFETITIYPDDLTFSLGLVRGIFFLSRQLTELIDRAVQYSFGSVAIERGQVLLLLCAT